MYVYLVIQSMPYELENISACFDSFEKAKNFIENIVSIKLINPNDPEEAWYWKDSDEYDYTITKMLVE